MVLRIFDPTVRWKSQRFSLFVLFGMPWRKEVGKVWASLKQTSWEEIEVSMWFCRGVAGQVRGVSRLVKDPHLPNEISGWRRFFAHITTWHGFHCEGKSNVKLLTLVWNTISVVSFADEWIMGITGWGSFLFGLTRCRNTKVRGAHLAVVVGGLGVVFTLTMGRTKASLSPDPAVLQSSSSSYEHPDPTPEKTMSSVTPSPRGVVCNDSSNTETD